MKKIISFIQHRRWQRALALYADNELPQNEMARVHKHLESCAACRHQLADMRACREVLRAGRTPLFVPMEQLWQRITARTSALPQKAFKRWGDFSSVNLRWAAAVALFIVMGATLWKKSIERGGEIVAPASATIDYGIFLDDLRHNVAEASFYKRYPAQVVQLADARQAVAFPLAKIEALPDSFRLDCVRVLECNGRKCIQFTCVKAGKTINIFQHALGQAWTIGQYNSACARVCSTECSIMNLKEVMAINWQGKDSEYLAIGELTPQELAQVVEVLR
ncbi:hypothetical protein EDS67_04055 [candidate division KSB1 bacterium]|nr:MAG: hypothetical protein EDS67_04055 [candidate division KSB1 bacterium]MBC6951793.1 hypothetical protein [candidate division KSB1 bacterium]MCE7940101.1 hypothetical protein [Chlorobi bacterium CHB1]MDL1879073.1 hypothetical protein [Cytophagia bacterium CHB2]